MKKNKKIFVTGDIAIDQIEVFTSYQSDSSTENWKNYPGVAKEKQAGGSFILADMIRTTTDAEVISPELLTDIELVPSNQIIHSCVELKKDEGEKNSYHISEYKGYCGPDKGLPKCFTDKKILKYPVDARDADIVVINDAGNGFRDSDCLSIDTIADRSIILYKVHFPLCHGKMWRDLKEIDSDRLVVIVNADDLRKINEVNISRSLSWERTAKDFVWHITNNPALQQLKECSHLIILFGTDGAIMHRNNEIHRETLIFDPNNLEGQFSASCPGQMMGMNSAFVAALTSELYREGLAKLEEGIFKGLHAMRRIQTWGFQEKAGKISYPIDILFADAEKSSNDCFVEIKIPFTPEERSADPSYWRILDEKTKNTQKLVAENIVRNGVKKGLPGVPTGVFGYLKTIDRKEIESYSGIKNLIAEFIADRKAPRPLSLAVFGAPGSGKSFGVMEVANSVGGNLVEKIEFNISQFQSLKDLISAFHKVRNIVLKGKIPFVFFDEFDSTLEGESLGWLKYFLAPMQDGCFREGETDHPLGKAIFVFAGGTSHSFEMFTRENENEDMKRKFALAKGPDFVSRLRGFINIMGVNPVNEEDRSFIIRRAIILRVMFELAKKAKGLFNNRKELNIDKGLLRAFLNVPEYKHGTRSLGAILDMSTLVDVKQFNQAALPPAHQLNLHLDAEAFTFLAEKDRFTNHPQKESAIIEQLAESMYERTDNYLQKSSKKSKSFSELSLIEKNNWQMIAEDIPRKLASINCGVREIDNNRISANPDITEKEVEKLVHLEHELYCRKKSLQGWRYKKGKENHETKTSPYLMSFSKLPEERKQYYRQMIWDIPLILHLSKLEVFRMTEVNEIDDESMIDILARLIHKDYCENRKASGDTLKTNPSLCPFDQLSDDLRDANIDNARSIPVKLRYIGYKIRRVREGKKPELPKFTKDEIEIMARIEHDRWNWQKRLQGWKYKKGPKSDKKKTSPYILPWDQLSNEIQEYDRETVRLIPELLAKANYEAYKDR